MNTPTRTAALIAALILTTFLAAPASAAGSKLTPVSPDLADGAVFPKVTGDSLSGKTFRLPGDLEGELNLLLIAFRRYQQADVNTWMPLGDDLERRFGGFRYYEIPTISAGYTVVRSFIDGGMRGGIPNRTQRARTITLYIDKAPYRESLNIRSENSIYAALVNRQGEVLFMTDGRHSADKAKLLVAEIEKRLPRRAPAAAKASRASAEKAAKSAAAPTADIVETALASGRFTILTRALGAAGLVKALQGEGPFTVFAPSDEAFAKLPKGTVDELLRPENRERLVEVLTYHVVPGRYPAAKVIGSRRAVTLAKKPLTFRAEAGAVRINGARVIAADVNATNGVIHVIDTVLIPPAKRSVEKRNVRGVIELACERGVPLFNAGRVDSCAAIYEVAAVSLLSFSDELSDGDRDRLAEALAEADGQDDPRRKAWTLRRALDAVYHGRPSRSPASE